MILFEMLMMMISLGQYPWIAALGYQFPNLSQFGGFQFYCGGTLVSFFLFVLSLINQKLTLDLGYIMNRWICNEFYLLWTGHPVTYPNLGSLYQSIFVSVVNFRMKAFDNIYVFVYIELFLNFLGKLLV